MKLIRNVGGAILLVIGAYIFQFGFLIITDDYKDKFASGLWERLNEHFQGNFRI